MVKVTFEYVPGVWISITGERKEGSRRLPKDDGLVGRFMNWLSDNGILSISCAGGHCGPGTYAHFFSLEDAKKIKAWLIEQGVKEE